MTYYTNNIQEIDLSMDRVFVAEVIISTKKRRGNGIDDPIRVITEVFTKEGTLIAEHDPMIKHPDQ